MAPVQQFSVDQFSVEPCSLDSFSTQGARPDVDPQVGTDFASLVETYSALLFRVAHSVLRSRAEAEDVVQGVFLRVLKHRRSLPAVRDLRVWLVRITWNLALDHRRRIRPEQLDDLFAESLIASSVPADEALDQAQRMKSVLREMERLPKAERHVMLLSAIDELETAEMAQVLGRSESAIRALLFRARARLRERLEEQTRPAKLDRRKLDKQGGER
jgi:RNA polymerase sigma-70 factor, ECF subfamily